MELNPLYMQRALQLARNGYGMTAPNPMVGAVIVEPSGRIIGQGWHRVCGSAHAEVNAVGAVRPAHRHLLTESTMYVTLEPCSHYGRTPPCSKLIIDCGIPRVCVAAVDPFSKVAGRGIAMLREAGVEVETGLMDTESQQLNAVFNTAHTLHRPFVTLKWAQSADGFMDAERTDNGAAMAFSTATSRLAVHRLRGASEAIMVGSGTALADRPRLDNRLWPGRSPQPIVLDRRQRLDTNLLPPGTIVATAQDLAQTLHSLYADHGITSVLVEGGAQLLESFIAEGLWDAARIETAPHALGTHGRAKAPALSAPAIAVLSTEPNTVVWYSNNALFTASHPMVC